MVLKRALVIEDDPPTAHLHRLLLEEAQFVQQILAVHTCEEGISVLRQWRNHPPELILLDIQMPGMNGWKFLDHLSQQRYPTDKRPKVMILSNDVRAPHQRLIKAYSDAIGIWEKPLTKELLQSVMGPQLASIRW